MKRKPKKIIRTPGYRVVRSAWDDIMLEKYDGKDRMGVERWKDVAPVPENHLDWQRAVRQIGWRLEKRKEIRRKLHLPR